MSDEERSEPSKNSEHSEEHLETLNSLLNNYDKKEKSEKNDKKSDSKSKNDKKSDKKNEKQSEKQNEKQSERQSERNSDSQRNKRDQEPDQKKIFRRSEELTTSSEETPNFRDTPPSVRRQSTETESELSIELPAVLPNANEFNYFKHQTKKMPVVRESTPVGISSMDQNEPQYQPYQRPTHPLQQTHQASNYQNQIHQQTLIHQQSPLNHPQNQTHQQPQQNHQSQQNQQQIPTHQNHQPPNHQPTTQQSPQVEQKTFQIVHKGSPPGTESGITPLTVVTFNIWCGKKNQIARTKKLIQQLTNNGNKYLPDIVCLQEVTVRAYQVLQTGLSQQYHLIDLFAEQQVPYCNVICINKETMAMTGNVVSYDFDSQMGRKLMVCPLKIRATNTQFHLLNAHLESLMDNWKYRKNQLESIYRLIREEKLKNYILAGDFNIYHHSEPAESQIRLYEFLDAWTEMGSPESLKFTYHYKQNPYAHENSAEKGKTISRFDRILYNFKDNQMVINKLKLLGVKEPHISDHFGLLAEFVIRE